MKSRHPPSRGQVEGPPADALLSDAENALEAGDSARDVARAYLKRADRAGVLPELVALLRSYDPGAPEDLVVDHLLRDHEDGAWMEAGQGGARLTNLADVQPEPVRWCWPGRIPFGKLTIVDGDPGVLKSTMHLDLAARLSRGAAMPDGRRPDVDGPRGTVLLTAEDGLADTIRPRLDAAGADVVQVVALQAVQADDGDRLPTVDDLHALRDAIEAVDAALVVVDPLVAYLGPDVNSYRDQDVRAALAGLAELADDTGVAVLAIRHLNKSGGDNPLHRGGGSIGLIAAARSGLLVARDPEAPDGERRILATTKANLAPEPPALAFRPKVVDGVVALSWEGETEHAARDLLDTASKEERSAREEAADVLQEELRNGPRPVQELRDVADRLGVSWRTVQRAARSIDVKKEREGGIGADGRWVWRLPAPSSRQPVGLAGEDGREPPRAKGSPKTTGGAVGLGNGQSKPTDSDDSDPYPDSVSGIEREGFQTSLDHRLGGRE